MQRVWHVTLHMKWICMDLYRFVWICMTLHMCIQEIVCHRFIWAPALRHLGRASEMTIRSPGIQTGAFHDNCSARNGCHGMCLPRGSDFNDCTIARHNSAAFKMDFKVPVANSFPGCLGITTRPFLIGCLYISCLDPWRWRYQPSFLSRFRISFILATNITIML